MLSPLATVHRLKEIHPRLWKSWSSDVKHVALDYVLQRQTDDRRTLNEAYAVAKRLNSTTGREERYV